MYIICIRADQTTRTTVFSNECMFAASALAVVLAAGSGLCVGFEGNPLTHTHTLSTPLTGCTPGVWGGALDDS